MNPDFMRLSYLYHLSNFHEVGHYIMGKREELAEQYGALKHRQEHPETLGLLQMIRDFRNIYFLAGGGSKTLTDYRQTAKSLNHVLGLKQEDVDKLTEEELVVAAREGHAPDKIIPDDDSKAVFRFSSFEQRDKALERSYREIAGVKTELSLRVAFFEEYQKQEKVLGVENKSTTAQYYLESNRHSLSIANYWWQKNASLEGMSKDKEFLKCEKSMEKYENYEPKEDLDPEILAKTAGCFLKRYKPGSAEYKILSEAAVGLKNFKDPVGSYGLTLNFKAKPGWDDSVVHVEKDILSRVEYDGFAELRRELRNADSDLAPVCERDVSVKTHGVVKSMETAVFDDSPKDGSKNPDDDMCRPKSAPDFVK
jgi:hypothetical protein